MTVKKIPGPAADFLSDAAKRLAKLNNAFDALRFGVCWKEHPVTHFHVRDIRRECRALVAAVKMLELWMDEGKRPTMPLPPEEPERKTKVKIFTIDGGKAS